MNKINYSGSSKILLRICQAINSLIDAEVTITPILSQGTKIAKYKKGSTEVFLYAPEGGGGGGSDDPRLHRTLKIHVVDGELHVSGIATD